MPNARTLAMTPTPAKFLHIAIRIAADSKQLDGVFHVPAQANGVVLFAHGTGSGRNSPRNQFVAQILQDAGLATLLVDLLTDEEAADRENVFDISLLADRLELAAEWLSARDETRGLRLGLFGASTG